MRLGGNRDVSVGLGSFARNRPFSEVVVVRTGSTETLREVTSSEEYKPGLSRTSWFLYKDGRNTLNSKKKEER